MPIIVEPGTAGSITYTIDPTSEDATNTPLELVDNSTQHLTAEDLPTPAEQPIWASSADTEGAALVSNRHENRQVTLTVRLHGTSETDLDAKILAISEKVEKLRREGGTLQRTLPSGETYVLDVLAGTTQPVWGQRGYVANWRIDVTLSLTCKPYWRGTEETLSDHVETTLPALVFTETGIKGDVPALGKLVVDNDDATSDQWFAMWGLQSRHYDSATTAKLFYEAEDLTLQSGSAVVSGAVWSSVLSSSYRSVLSTMISASSAHLSHRGDFRVWARANSEAGTSATCRLEWAQGDFSKTTSNPSAVVPTTPTLVDLGLVHLPAAVSGVDQWEGRIAAKDSQGAGTARLVIDSVFIVPVTEGYGEVRGGAAVNTPTSVLAEDAFTGTTAAAALNARTATAGGSWATSGATTDFAFADAPSTHETVARSTVSDSGNGRFAILGTTNYTTMQVRSRFQLSTGASSGTQAGLIARWVDASNYLALRTTSISSGSTNAAGIELISVVAGAQTTLASSGLSPTIVAGQWYQLVLAAYPSGRVVGQLCAGDGTALVSISAFSTAVATGGALATGKPGLVDRNSSGTASTRYYDDFMVASATTDPAIFASQSLEIRHNAVIREDSAGALMQSPAKYEGSYLIVPPAGAEGRSARLLVKTSRNDPDVAGDSAIDDISARLTYTPRFLHVPE